MKRTSRMVVLVGLAILVIAMLHLRNPLLADGGAPMPPWPQASGFLTMDVGAMRTAVAPEHSGTPRA